MNKVLNKYVLVGSVLVLAFLIVGSVAVTNSSSSSNTASIIDTIKGWFGSKQTTSTGTTASTPAATGNGAPSGAHFNLNVIGVAKNKIASLTGGDGHRIFVPIEGKCTIKLAPGDFQVVDGNCTDGPAAFNLPDPDPDGDGVTAYSVYVRALGKPGGKARATSCATDGLETWCSTESVVLVRGTGKSTFVNASKQLLSVCMDTSGDGVCDIRSFLFDDALLSYLWDYDNQGLKLAQFRFYQVPTEVGLTP